MTLLPGQLNPLHERKIGWVTTQEHKGLIFNIQRFSLHDGPGIRTTVFLKGCPLRCKWCSNPESMIAYPEIMLFDMKCIKFGKCIEICSQDAIAVVDGMRRVDWSKCNQCLECARVCPSGGIEVVGNYMSVEETVAEIEKDWLFYLNSGGGVTFSGGEPLYQWEFVREVAKQCKKKGIHTALDTSGYARWEAIEPVLEYIDLVLYDIKQLDPQIHKEGTGVTNELILDNAAKITAKVKTWLRIPLIPGFNDSEQHIREIARLGMQMGVEKISLLPYHQWGIQKYAKLGRSYPFEDAEPLPEERIQELKDLVESYELQVAVGG